MHCTTHITQACITIVIVYNFLPYRSHRDKTKSPRYAPTSGLALHHDLCSKRPLIAADLAYIFAIIGNAIRKLNGLGASGHRHLPSDTDVAMLL